MENNDNPYASPAAALGEAAPKASGRRWNPLLAGPMAGAVFGGLGGGVLAGVFSFAASALTYEPPSPFDSGDLRWTVPAPLDAAETGALTGLVCGGILGAVVGGVMGIYCLVARRATPRSIARDAAVIGAFAAFFVGREVGNMLRGRFHIGPDMLLWSAVGLAMVAGAIGAAVLGQWLLRNSRS